jgi:iron only hydrogenase large subunit-like protein
MNKRHSVLLKEDLCEGCTNCVKNCPTKAIRVHQGKAMIKEELCIDCAECIRTCVYHAKYTRTDQLEDIAEYNYPVALVPPSFYGQFDNLKPVEVVAALHQLGFKEVKDVALAAEALSIKTIELLESGESSKYISSSCPVVVRLIKLLYPELLDYLVPFKSPVELMGEKVRREALEKGIPEGDLGVFFITPCPAKLTTIYHPPGMAQSFIDKAIAVEKVYQQVIRVIDELKKGEGVMDGLNIVGQLLDYRTPFLGIGWGKNSGEADILKARQQKETISVSGIHNVKAVLEELSRDTLKGIRYFELVACSQGCVGGVLNVNNPFQAKYNLERLIEEHPQEVEQDYSKYSYELQRKFKAEEAGSLDSDIEKAMEKLNQLEKEMEILPGLDCAACGAPDCATLAEDIVSGRANQSDCIFVLRQQVGNLADKMSELAHALPPVMKVKKKPDNREEN